MKDDKKLKTAGNPEEITQAEGYPIYPPKEDIYSNDIHTNIDEDNLRTIKEEDIQRSTWNEKSFEDDLSGDDLDVPGAELDDDMEDIGSEDEENNYYSLGDDNDVELGEED